MMQHEPCPKILWCLCVCHDALMIQISILQLLSGTCITMSPWTKPYTFQECSYNFYIRYMYHNVPLNKTLHVSRMLLQLLSGTCITMSPWTKPYTFQECFEIMPQQNHNATKHGFFKWNCNSLYPKDTSWRNETANLDLIAQRCWMLQILPMSIGLVRRGHSGIQGGLWVAGELLCRMEWEDHSGKKFRKGGFRKPNDPLSP